MFRVIYKEKSLRTIWRELFRLHGLGFIEIDGRAEVMPDWTVRVRFDAIEKY